MDNSLALKRGIDGFKIQKASLAATLEE